MRKEPKVPPASDKPREFYFVPLPPEVSKEIWEFERYVQQIADNIMSVPLSIQCPVCRRVSFHPQDVIEGYCAHCHDFTSPKKPNQSVKP